MSRHNQALWSLSWTLIKHVTGVAIVVNLSLVLAQLIKLSRALSSLAPLAFFKSQSELIHMVMWAAPVMWEATAPLLALIVTALTYHRLQLEGLTLAWRATGSDPLKLIFPAVTLGGLLAVSAVYTAHCLTPHALNVISGELRTLASQGLTAQLRRGHIRGLTPSGRGALTTLQGPLIALRDDERHFIWLWSPSERSYMRAHLDSSGGDPLQRSTQGYTLELSSVSAHTPRASLHLDRLSLSLDAKPLSKALKSLSKPNCVSSEQLGVSPHELFTLHKRTALPSSAVAWSILGALLGLLGHAQRSTLIAGGLIAAAYSLLRYLELRARFHGGDPVWAAWTPSLLLTLGAFAALILWLRRGGRW